jgi:hypothetical protein
MKISLVTSTIGRVSIAELLDSIVGQQDPDIEVVVVDQSDEGAVRDLVEARREELAVTYLRQSGRGLSRGRNLGIAHAAGEVVAFPDDDCFYRPGVLDQVRRAFERDETLAGVLLRPRGPGGERVLGEFEPASGPASPQRLWRQATSIGMFLRRDSVLAVGSFDVRVGLGAATPWGSAEDIDLPLRILRAGGRLQYCSVSGVVHPADPEVERDPRRGRGYGQGAGFVLGMHRRPPAEVARMISRPLLGAGLALARGDRDTARFRAEVALGRARGWRAGRRAQPLVEPVEVGPATAEVVDVTAVNTGSNGTSLVR